ncbi:stage V sporulation protein D (sporulation-specific penicillin-binding protein) [Scopulibacillus darangshiensis]|uniref:Stage V sporulation protein D (Sporulation-specific penicillin-binding protein) n=1 Tax=Scopulibacillus darangshiensis TaxID=442528 RepID=A0A4V2SMY0_9BACL|nr:stage V sporulation protein D [Scopulibacillus darangshiensis]TCP29086.1 stage V sporulation protein D (sporulation-specific penicillin-binding protein) [Scopulibacillus darangshiensis]
MRVSNVTVRKRLIVILLIGIVVFAVFIVRLGYVQFFKNGWLSGKALDSWSRQIPYEAERGDILDRNGKELATNVSRPSVLVVPKQVKDPVKTAEKLSSVLGMSKEDAYKDITKKESIVRITPEGRKISNEKAAEVKSLRMPGVFIAEDFKRHYPHGSYLSHVLGFAGIDNQGLIGLEKYYDDRLKGEKGHVSFFSDAQGNRMSSLKDKYVPPKDGLDLELTIDHQVQSIIERELNNAEQKYHPDSAIAIAMNPNTGEILGMSSRPDFNPENYKNVLPEVYNHNLPIWRTYEPGSTFKVITLAAALEENKVNLKHDHFYDPGYITVAGHKLHCWKRGGHGSETFLEVVENSCNPGFVALGQRLGKDKLQKYIRDFGFGQKTGIDLQGEAKGILFRPEKMGPLELATTSFGQGVSVTPIQQVTAVSAAVNGGYLYEPYIAKAWKDPETGETVSRTSPTMKRRVISEETSKKVRYALESVVANGSGKNAYIDGYRVGGKTGTAQKVKDGHYLKNNYILSFMGFAPANDPKIVVYVAIDNPKGAIQFGGQTAAPIAKNIIGDSLRALGVKKQKGGMEKEKSYTDEPIIEVPNLVGKDKKEIRHSLYNLKIDTAGQGDVVVMQSPKPGVKLKSGSTIRIYLGDKKQPDD